MERRPEQDQIIHQGDEIEIWRLDSFERGEVDLKLCQAASDLIYGRTPKSEGIQYLFNALPHINAVELKFYREKTSVSPDLNGSYQQTKTTVLTVSLRLDRARASQLKLDSIRDIFQGSACVQRARQFFDEIWLSEEIQSRRDQLQRIALERKARGLSAAPVVQQ